MASEHESSSLESVVEVDENHPRDDEKNLVEGPGKLAEAAGRPARPSAAPARQPLSTASPRSARRPATPRQHTVRGHVVVVVVAAAVVSLVVLLKRT